MEPNSDAGRRDHLQTLERGLVVISAFSHAPTPWLTASDLARSTGLSVPTVRRIMLTLERLGYARGSANRFALTPKVLGLGYAYLASVNLTGAAHPHMEALSGELAMGTSLATLDGTDVVYVDRVQRRLVTSNLLAVGSRLPAHATAMGHVLLADLDDTELDHYLSAVTLDALTHQTLDTSARLRERLDTVRDRGFEIVDQELEIGRRSAAAPVRDASGQVVAALALSCGIGDFSVEAIAGELVPPLRRTADAISRELGHVPSARAASFS
ncbi:MAG: IclR family transcriptional regulator C-terminal domain-containing protein [Gordonia amarae]